MTGGFVAIGDRAIVTRIVARRAVRFERGSVGAEPRRDPSPVGSVRGGRPGTGHRGGGALLGSRCTRVVPGAVTPKCKNTRLTVSPTCAR
jgi:hypothetical protein